MRIKFHGDDLAALRRGLDGARGRLHGLRERRGVLTGGAGVDRAPEAEPAAFFPAQLTEALGLFAARMRRPRPPPRGQSPAALEAQIAALLQKAAQQLAERALGPAAQAPQKLVDQIVPKQIQQVISMMQVPQHAAAKLALDVAKRMPIGERNRDR